LLLLVSLIKQNDLRLISRLFSFAFASKGVQYIHRLQPLHHKASCGAHLHSYTIIYPWIFHRTRLNCSLFKFIW
jgi:hypothetical protein